jgi:lipid A 3-O-deacylase
MSEMATLITLAALLVPASAPVSAEEQYDQVLTLPAVVVRNPSASSSEPAALPDLPAMLQQVDFRCQPEPVTETPVYQCAACDPFARGACSCEVNGGAYFSQPGIGPRTPTFDFAPINVRLGLMLNDPCFPSCLRGNFEALVEFSTAPIFDGFGDIVLGPTALLRYNWVQPGSRFVPYLQGGAGFVYNNAFEDRNQRAVGEAIEFALKAAVGCHYFVNDHLSLDVEGGYIHISNADLASRNLGINAVGASLGMTLYFPCGR